MKRALYAAVAISALITPFLAPSPSWARTAAPATAPAAPSGPLKLGDHGYAVTVIQMKLASMGYSIDVDGDYGFQTQDRVMRWQKANAALVDGITGTETLKTLGLTPENLVPVTGTPTTPKTATRPPNSGQNTPKQPKTAPNPAPQPPDSTVSGDPESIIRAVWPDELEEHALRIARRESNLQPAVVNRNGDATGLFQIMWSVHRSWLCPQMGVCAQSDLQDAQINAEAALALYGRAGGFGPWSL